jgi:hypothetical protein
MNLDLTLSFKMERTAEIIKKEMEVNKAKRNLLMEEYHALNRELFNKEFVEVQWNDAEKYFIGKLNPDDNWVDGPVACKFIDFPDGRMHIIKTNVSIEKWSDDYFEMWLGGFYSKDGFPRGESFYVERRYGDEINK